VAELAGMKQPMRLGGHEPITAFCILCHDADAVLPFYCDILGFDPKRAEESFFHFDRRGTATALCLWEIGHLARHTVFTNYSDTAVPNKIVLSLTMTSRVEVDALRQKLAAANMRLLADLGEGDEYGFYFIDPCAVIWEVRVRENKDSCDVLALDRITLICQDLTATKTFYESKLGFPSGKSVNGRVTYAAVDHTALSLWDCTAASTALNTVDFRNQKQVWSANTAMLAYSFEKIEYVQTLYDGLSAAGVPFDEAPTHFAWDFSACYFRDPEDNIWELFEVPANIKQRMLPQTGKE